MVCAAKFMLPLKRGIWVLWHKPHGNALLASLGWLFGQVPWNGTPLSNAKKNWMLSPTTFFKKKLRPICFEFEPVVMWCPLLLQSSSKWLIILDITNINGNAIAFICFSFVKYKKNLYISDSAQNKKVWSVAAIAVTKSMVPLHSPNFFLRICLGSTPVSAWNRRACLGTAKGRLRPQPSRDDRPKRHKAAQCMPCEREGESRGGSRLVRGTAPFSLNMLLNLQTVRLCCKVYKKGMPWAVRMMVIKVFLGHWF